MLFALSIAPDESTHTNSDPCRDKKDACRQHTQHPSYCAQGWSLTLTVGLGQQRELTFQCFHPLHGRQEDSTAGCFQPKAHPHCLYAFKFIFFSLDQETAFRTSLLVVITSVCFGFTAPRSGTACKPGFLPMKPEKFHRR